MLFPFDLIYETTATLLPAKMANQEAKAMLYSIGMQESRFIHRRQVGGPARGMWQFEAGGGVAGVLSHSATKGIIHDVLDQLQYDRTVATSYEAIAHNDILACAYARAATGPQECRRGPSPVPVGVEARSPASSYLGAIFRAGLGRGAAGLKNCPKRLQKTIRNQRAKFC
jgi:hypothetical protein